MPTQVDNTQLVIMAGGSGQRLWPRSTKSLPKQFHDFLGTGKTLLQATAERFKAIIPPKQIWVVTHVDYIPIVKKQLPWIKKQQVLGEPVASNTAPCIAYTCSKITKVHPEATLIITPADHHIQEQELFIKALQQALECDHASSSSICLLGIPPKSPETGYGYIGYHPGQKGPVQDVTEFVEKPPIAQAQQYLQQGNYVWNMGIFIGGIRAFIKNFQTYLPDVWDPFVELERLHKKDQQKLETRKLRTKELRTKEKLQAKEKLQTKEELRTNLHQLYQLLPNVSFDQGILEKAKGLHVVVCQDVGWSDLGTWHALYQHLDKDEDGNACQGQVVTMATKNCLITGNNQLLIATYGLDNLVIVQHNGALLICPQNEVQNLKKLLEKLKLHDKNF